MSNNLSGVPLTSWLIKIFIYKSVFFFVVVVVFPYELNMQDLKNDTNKMRKLCQFSLGEF
jgi:hypothetical protein